MKSILSELRAGHTLSREDAASTLTKILLGEISTEQVSAFLTFLSARLPTIEEFGGFHSVLSEQGKKVQLGDSLIDLCGTGGDQKNTFNISTAAAFVVAGAGFKVAKHGNYSASSSCGSSTVLEALGLRFTNNDSELKKNLETSGLCILHAPLFQPGLKAIAPIRKNLGIPTFFNLLGPLLNPASPSYQIIGVPTAEIQQLMKFYLAANDGICVIHSRAGYDEFSLVGACDVVSSGATKSIYPEDLKLGRVSPKDIESPGSPKESAELIVKILSGKGTLQQQSVVKANAALAIYSSDKNRSLIDCVAVAEESIVSGRAFKVLKNLQS